MAANQKIARYVVVRDPSDLWMVFDAEVGCPAEVGTLVLIGLASNDAVLLARMLQGGLAPLKPRDTRSGLWPPTRQETAEKDDKAAAGASKNSRLQ